MTRLSQRRLALSAVGAALLLASGTSADAVTTVTTTFNVNASILAACSLTAADLNFGTYSPTAGAVNTNSSAITVNCTKGTTFTLALNVGSATGSTFAPRHLANGTNTLNYNLYTTSAANSPVWGDGTNATVTVGGTGNGLLVANAVTETVYGQIPINQDLPAGTYTRLPLSSVPTALRALPH